MLLQCGMQPTVKRERSICCRNRRRVLTNVFYVIVLHCAVLDVARGLCLIVYGLPYFANSIYKIALSISTKVALFRVRCMFSFYSFLFHFVASRVVSLVL